jgi:uncharacterized DUF497 family protein
MEFGWDERKAAHNLAKHGVPFSEAAAVFYDPLSITYGDPDHSMDEDRYITIGLSGQGRLLIVSHADQGDVIRIISARPVTKREKKLYESGR